MKHSTLRTQMQVATARAAAIARAAAKAEHAEAWKARLDPAAYTCHRDGAAWIAEGPAGQRFEFSRTEADDVLCISASGGIYLLPAGGGCDCKAAAKSADGSCKHQIAFKAVLMAHRMERIETRAALSAEAAELNRLREAAEDAARRCRAEAESAEVSAECWR